MFIEHIWRTKLIAHFRLHSVCAHSVRNANWRSIITAPLFSKWPLMLSVNILLVFERNTFCFK